MKDLAMDESLSEEARDSARKALEVLASSQLLDIEQAAAIKKLESEADFVHQQARIEALAEAKKVEVESLAESKTTEAEIKKLEAQAQLKRQRADAKKMLQAAQDFEQTAQVLSDDMMEWLGQHRLQQCAADMARIAGACAAASFRCDCWIPASLVVLCLQDCAAKRPAILDRRGRRRDR